MLIFVFFLVEVTEVRDVLQPPESICVSKTIAMQKQNMFALSCIFVAVLWVYEYAVQVVVSWMMFLCCMLIVVTVVVALDYILFSKLHADIS